VGEWERRGCVRTRRLWETTTCTHTHTDTSKTYIHTHAHTHSQTHTYTLTQRDADDEGPDKFTLEDDFDMMTPHGLDYRHVTGITFVPVVSHCMCECVRACMCVRVHA
jgi:hypothetical protein